jgi:GABA(A) receptor-associated protein
MNFKTQYTFKERFNDTAMIREKYPDRIPCILQSKTTQIHLNKHKYLLPQDLSVSQFIYIVRKKVDIKPEQAVFLFVNDTIPAGSMMISQLYQEQRDTDNYLYFFMCFENTFGETT